jgi:hypothetical protein
MMRSTHVLLVLAIGCVREPAAPPVRFANAPIARAVNDRVNVERPPKSRRALLSYYAYQESISRPVEHALELPRHRRAEGINAIDEVPDSTWFTNRRGLSVEQMRAGPGTLDSPEKHLPWTIESTGYGGSSISFIIRDARGIKYLVKFDNAGLPEAETAADAIASRLIWACGYNVPEDQVVVFPRDQLRLSPTALVKGAFGARVRTLDASEVEQKLAKVAREPGGWLRGIASRWLDGKALGAPPVEGVRSDDPNDLVPHELRRDLRGLRVIYAWLDMVDTVPGNFLDLWTQDPAEPSRHYVKHYAIDFGSSLGVMGTKTDDPRGGQTYRVDWGNMSRNLATGGLATLPQGDRGNVNIRGVAPLFEAQAFDPPAWRPEFGYAPFNEMDRIDGFWAAKLVARLTRAQIRAAVEAGRYSDPRAVDYVTDTLVARQHTTAAYWYRQVNPLDMFEVNDELCFDDLAIAQGYTAASSTRYTISATDRLGRRIGSTVGTAAARDGHTCIATPPLSGQPDRYTVFRVETARPGFRKSTDVHVARDGAGAVRVVGLWRE